MHLIRGILSAIMSVVVFFSSLLGIGTNPTPVDKDDFRITSYIVARDIRAQNFDASHLPQLTDIILFGCATFDEQGNVSLDSDVASLVSKLRSGSDAKVHLNLLGPDANTGSDDWNEQMKDKGNRHNNAFRSGVLEENIKSTIETYGFDGVFFDYEFTMSAINWYIFSNFLVDLDKVLGNDCILGLALASWDINLSYFAKKVVDRVEVMSYDNWDADGNHAPYSLAQSDIEQFIKAGFEANKLDLGVPFYARPTTGEAYWYAYCDYVNGLDANGRIIDSKTGLTFSFNTCDLIKQKTQLALDTGCGGMMVWEYHCDVSAENPLSLFSAIVEVLGR